MIELETKPTFIFYNNQVCKIYFVEIKNCKVQA